MNILKRIKQFKSQSGFTMIELLVVIAVIGVLAVAVLASINPIEQINKGRDTRLRSNAAQLLNAIDRYYAIQEKYPWNADPALALDTPDLAYPTTDNSFVDIGGSTYTPLTWVQYLADTEEVKDSFVDQLSNTSATNVLHLQKLEDGDVYICFEPASKQFQIEAINGCVNRKASLPTTACIDSVSYTPQTAWTSELICLP